jgi:hypothetical protein
MATANGSVKSQVLWFAAIVLMLGAPSLTTAAQQPRVLAPHQPVAPRLPRNKSWDPPAKSQSLVGGYWMISPNFNARVYLSNSLKYDALSVTLILHISNGVQYTLPPVKVDPSGTAVIDINQSLANQGIAPYANLSGYVELQYQWGWAAVCATVRNIDTVHSLIFMSALQSSKDASLPQDPAAPVSQLQTFEGMWWKQESGVTGFLALSNVSAQPVNATVQLTDNQNAILANHTVIVSPHGTKTVNLDELLSAPGLTGGVLVTHDGPAGALLLNGGLQDAATGYSAGLPIGPLPDPSAKVSTAAYSELGLMSGAADPMLSFPNGTVFTPYAVARNVSSQSISVSPTLWWMEGGAPRSAQLPQFTVLPHHTQSMDLPALMSGAGLRNFNGSLNLVLDTQGPSGGLMMASGSVDRKNTYVFEVMPRSVSESVSKSLSYWSTGNGDDTMGDALESRR